MSSTHATSQPRFTNRLAAATSPYLLQHAHNPVDWHPWGPEALRLAREQNKPIFLSIGYAACHWCHVMAHESFESEAIADVLNQHFVSIKVDREERPDLDDIYMKATQLYNSGGGGWPMSVFLMPDGRPFFAGTYFPPESRWGRPGFKELLETLARLWKADHAKIEAGAESLTQGVRQISVVTHGTELIPAELVSLAAGTLARAFDRQTGGISGGGPNKFPPSMAMDLLLREQHRLRRLSATQPAAGTPQSQASRPEGDSRMAEEYLSLVALTLDHMSRGGIYDHLAGGIARYSTDPRWLVPHFEKMLYDQALVAGIYLDGHLVTREPRYADVARGILSYVIDDLQSPSGGYYSTRDADSEGEEGKYYVWSRAEVNRLLGPDAEVFCSYYDVTDGGNWEGTNILNVPRDADTVARLHNMTTDELKRRLEAGRQRLLQERSTRVPPGLDDKIIAAWNGLMIASMARGGAILNEPRFVQSAERAGRDILATLRRGDGRLLRTSRGGKAHTLAYLDDHAFLIEGLITLYEVTGNADWLVAADGLTQDVERYFADPAGAYYFSPVDGEKLLVRGKDASDGAIPSGNAVHLMNLLRLSVLLDNKAYVDAAERLMKALEPTVRRAPHGSERLLAAVDFHWRRPREIAIVRPAGGNVPLCQDPLLRTVWSVYVPNKVIAHSTGKAGSESPRLAMPLTNGKTALDNRTTVYVCRDFACKAPTTDSAELERQLTD